MQFLGKESMLKVLQKELDQVMLYEVLLKSAIKALTPMAGVTLTSTQPKNVGVEDEEIRAKVAALPPAQHKVWHYLMLNKGHLVYDKARRATGLSSGSIGNAVWQLRGKGLIKPAGEKGRYNLA